jgi:hypothetical protein
MALAWLVDEMYGLPTTSKKIQKKRELMLNPYLEVVGKPV